jgi:hypothetical protein
VDGKRFPEYYRYFERNGRSIKGDYAGISDPLQIGIIQKFRLQHDGSILIKIRILLRPENTTTSSVNISRSGKNHNNKCFLVHICPIDKTIIEFKQEPDFKSRQK